MEMPTWFKLMSMDLHVRTCKRYYTPSDQVSIPSSAVDPDFRLKKLLHIGSVPEKDLVDPYCVVSYAGHTVWQNYYTILAKFHWDLNVLTFSFRVVQKWWRKMQTQSGTMSWTLESGWGGITLVGFATVTATARVQLLAKWWLQPQGVIAVYVVSVICKASWQCMHLVVWTRLWILSLLNQYTGITTLLVTASTVT